MTAPSRRSVVLGGPTHRAVLSWYGDAVGVLAVVVLFTNTARYVYEQGMGPSPWLAVVGIAIVSIPALIDRVVMRGIRPELGLFVGVYLAAITVGFFRSTNSAVVVEELQSRLLGLFVIGFIAVLAGTDTTLKAMRLAMAAAVLFAVAANCYELFHPLSFSRDFGRSAGLYLNPNISGAAIVIGMAASVGSLPRRWRPCLVAASGVGVLLTLSRGGLVVWAATAGVLWLGGVFRVRDLLAAVVVGAVGLGLLAVTTGLGSRAAGALELARSDPNTWERLDPGASVGSSSAVARAEAFSAAAELFARHPLGGAGLASTVEWSHPVSTHNIYIRVLAEYGLLGALLVPILVFAIGWAVVPSCRASGLAVAVFVCLWGFVSHNILDERPLVVAMGLAIAFPRLPIRPRGLSRDNNLSSHGV